MKKLLSKTLTRLIAQSHSQSHSHSLGFSTTSNHSAGPLLLLPATKTSTSLVIQTVSSATPPTKKKVGSWPLWLFFVAVAYGLGETSRDKQIKYFKKHLEFRRICLEMEPRKLNTTKDVDSLGFRRVVCKGIFDEQRSIYVGPKPRSMANRFNKGFYVITPLLPIPNDPDSMKSPILVNRGWVPLDWKESKKANKLVSTQENLLSKFWYKFNNPMIVEEQVSRAKHVEVVGIVRKSEIPCMYSVTRHPKLLAWFFLDVPKLAQAMGFGEDTIYVEQTGKDMDESRPYPSPREVEDLISSKRIALDQLFSTVLWYLSYLACCLRCSSIMKQTNPNAFDQLTVVPIGYKRILVISFFLVYIYTEIDSLRDLFCIIDTIGVGCVTKLDLEQRDQVKDSIDSARDRGWHQLRLAARALGNRGEDLDQSEMEEKMWIMDSITREEKNTKKILWKISFRIRRLFIYISFSVSIS